MQIYQRPLKYTRSLFIYLPPECERDVLVHHLLTASSLRSGILILIIGRHHMMAGLRCHRVPGGILNPLRHTEQQHSSIRS